MSEALTCFGRFPGAEEILLHTPDILSPFLVSFTTFSAGLAGLVRATQVSFSTYVQSAEGGVVDEAHDGLEGILTSGDALVGLERDLCRWDCLQFFDLVWDVVSWRA